MEMSHRISILVRSKNDREFIGRTLQALSSQKCPVPFEIVSCDDGSTDGTTDIIASFPQVKRIPRPDGAYHPGKTLNHMLRSCEGDIVVFNNADAPPLDDGWLAALSEPLLAGRADAVYANQLPRPDAQYLVRKDSERAFGDGRIAATWRFFFSLASSGVLREDVLAHPFDEAIQYSEDVEWAHRRPLRIEYVPSARVEHSHNYTMAQLKKRFYGEGYADYQIFGTVPPFWRVCAGALRETLRDWGYLLRHPAGLGESFTAPLRRWLQKYHHWCGSRDAAAGKPFSPR